MRTLVFAKRNFKEIIREPISLIFSIGLPLFLLIIFQQFNIPSEIYNVENFTPGIAVFAFGFISLFSGLLIAQDRDSAFLARLYTSPLKASEFIKGYALSLLPIAVIQTILFFICAVCLGLPFSINIIICVVVLWLVSALFIAIGILLGCAFNSKAVGGFSSIIINLMCFASGMWFDVDSMGGVIQVVSRALPFSYAVDIARYSLKGDFSKMIFPSIILVVYTIVLFIFAVIVFKKKMKK